MSTYKPSTKYVTNFLITLQDDAGKLENCKLLIFKLFGIAILKLLKLFEKTISKPLILSCLFHHQVIKKSIWLTNTKTCSKLLM